MTPTYTIYSSGGTIVDTTTNLFRAINSARMSGTNAYVMQDGSQEVYRHGISGRYYRFQYTAPYGYVTTQAEIDAWLTGFFYTYIIDSMTGRMTGCNYTTQKGSPAPWFLEPNSGGYYYQVSQVYNGYRSVSRKVNLTKARLKPPSGSGQNFIPYIFFTVQNANISVDAGIFTAYDRGWNWYLCINTGSSFQVGDMICPCSVNGSGEYVASADLSFEVGYTAGQLVLKVKNLTTGVVSQMALDDSRIGGDCAIVSAISYVPSIDQVTTPDFRNGGYFISVESVDSYLYTTSDCTGTAVPFYSGSAATQFSLLYNTDCSIIVPSGAQDIVAIFYDRAYQT